MTKLTLFFGFGMLYLMFVGANVIYANKLQSQRTRLAWSDDKREEMAQMARKALAWMPMLVATVAAVLTGFAAAENWQDYLLFTHASSFNQTDPIFNRDIGFYVFRLPFLNVLHGFAFFAVISAAVGSAVIHIAHQGIDAAAMGRIRPEAHLRRHLLALAGAAAFLGAWGISLGRFGMLTNDNGSFFGAGFTDLHARLPAMYVSLALLVAVGAACFVSMNSSKPFRAPAAMLALWFVVSAVGGGIIPGMIQKFEVVPNQLGKEREYIAHDIAMTQKAYGLDKVVVKELGSKGTLSAEQVRANRPTIENIRLWDWPQLGAVYSSRQAIRTYYGFRLPDDSPYSAGDYNIDVDRYLIDGKMRQVMVSPRELNLTELSKQANTWQNQKLQYTHGYGAVMSPVNHVDEQGMPEFFLSELPVKSTKPEVKLDKPQIYFGEMTNSYVLTGSSAKEFDYASDAGTVESRYDGKGGVPLGGAFSRLMWSMRLADTNLLLSGELSGESRVLYRRNIRDRVRALAPFLKWDSDPYLVLTGGRMVWILDGFTTTSRYPYSKMSGAPEDDDRAFNYIRNSVKATVDAYDGSTSIYVADKNDPIIQSWSRVFPDLLQSIDKMPADLKLHLRYPEDLFRIQRDVYTLYHIPDPQTYYMKEDAWDVPPDPAAQAEGEGNARGGRANGHMEPYYVMMKLPDADQEEFLMMTPFTPRSKENLTAWMCAKCDPKDYGQLVVYRLPRGSNVNGPSQIMQLVKRQERISTFMTLQGQQGSKVSFGNLLVIPIGHELLYAVPVYVQAINAGTALPLISQVIVASGNRVAMEKTLDGAITSLFGGETTPAETIDSKTGKAVEGEPSAKPAVSARATDVVQQVKTAYERARSKQKEYNESLDELGKLLKQLK